MADIQQKIEDLVEEALPDSSLFIVEITTSLLGRKQRVDIRIDGDEGVTIEQCAEVSRKVGFQLEEQNIIEEAYKLEVSSPGVDQPLKLWRQYPKNKGRNLSLKLAEGKLLEARLDEVTEEIITVTPYKMKKKKKVFEESMEIPFNQIIEAKVLISFN